MNRSLRFGLVALLAIISLVATSSVSLAQIPRLISYQGLLTQPNGQPLADGQYGLVLRLYDAPAGGNLLWEETQQSQLFKGLFNLALGANVPLSGVDFFTTQVYLETAITGQQPFPRTRLAVVPYAIRAERADVAGGLDTSATGVVRSLNEAQGDLVIHGRSGISVSRSGDTIHIESTVSFSGIQSLTSPENTINVGSPSGPNTTVDVRDGAITTVKLANGSVTNVKLQDGSVTTSKVVDGSITLQKLFPGLIPTTLPPSGPASGDLTGSYPGPLIAPGAVTTSKLADNSVTTPKLTDGVVTTPKLADNSVTSSKLTNTGVTPGSFGNATNIPQVTVDEKGRVTGIVNVPLVNFPWIVPAGGDLTGTYPNPLIAPNAVTTAKILDGNVTTPKLADGSVTNAKLGSNSVTSDKILDGTIMLNDLSPGLVPITLPPSGPAGGELTGTYPNPIIQNGVITTPKIADGSVVNSKLADNSVTTNKIVDGTIILADLAPGLIPSTLAPSGPAGGVLSGTYPNPLLATTAGNQVLTAINDASTTLKLADNRLNTTGVAAGTYGDGATGFVPRVTIDQYGRITAAASQQILSAQPSGPAGGDLQGTYPAPLINPTAAAGSRIVDAVRVDFIAGDPDINTPSNLVVLDATNRLPAANASLLTNINANAINTGILAIANGGTNSGTSLVNGRLMWSNLGRIVEAPPLNAGQFFIGTSGVTAPIGGTIVAGPGINVTYTTPNLVVSSVDARLQPGTANDQTVRWDAGLNSWVPNTNVFATSAGNVTANGNLVVNGTTQMMGNTDIGVNPNTTNWLGKGAGSTNSVGSPTSTNWVYGNTNINTNVDANTNIGMMSGNTSSIVLAAGINGHIIMENIDLDVPYAFLSLNSFRQVRQTLAASLALEGIQFQNGAFRLGSENTLINPLTSNRFINLANQQLNFTGVNGTKTLINLNGAFPTVNITATTNINTTGTDLTTIGSPVSKTIIGGELDPRGVIRNSVASVVILDELEQYGQAQINYGTEAPTYIGNPFGAGQQQNVEIAVGGGVGPAGDLKLINIKTEAPIEDVLWIRADNKVRRSAFTDLSDEGVVFQNSKFRLGAGASGPTPLRTNSFDENRFVNLDAFKLRFTNGSEGVDGVTFFDLNGTNSTVGIGENATATHLLTINGTAQTNTVATPNVRIRHLGGNEFDPTPGQDYVDIGTNGFLIGDINGDIVKWDETEVIGGVAWLRIGNTIIDGNNILGTLNPIDLDVRTNNVNALTISSVDQTIGVGTAPSVGLARLNVDASALGAPGVGIIANAQDVGLQVGTAGTPVNAIEVDATGVGLLIRKNNPNGPAVGVSIDRSVTGLQVTAATNALDVEGQSFFNGDVRIEDDGTNAFGGADGVTLMRLRSGPSQGTNNLLVVENNAGENILTAWESGAGVSRVRIGSNANQGQIDMRNGLPGGVARIDVANSLNATQIYRIPTIEATGTFAVAVGQGNVDDILLSNGTSNRAIWTGSSIAEQGVSYMIEGGPKRFRMGGLANTDVPFLANRFVNLNAFNLSFTANGGGVSPLAITGGVNSGVTMQSRGTGTLNLTTVGTGAINITGNAAVAGNNSIVIDPGTAGGVGNEYDLVLNNIRSLSPIQDVLWITAANEVRRAAFTSIANEGIEFEAGAFRLGGTPDGTNPLVSDRYVSFDGVNGQLTFSTSTNERMLRFTSIGNVEVNATGNGTTTIGSALAGAISAQSLTTIGLTAGTTASIASVTTNINTGAGNVNIGNTAGTNALTGTQNNITGFANLNGDLRVEDVNGATPSNDGVTLLRLRAGTLQGTNNLLVVENNAGENILTAYESGVGVSRVRIGSTVNEGQLDIRNGAPNGLARIDVSAALVSTEVYRIPAVNGPGTFAIAQGQGLNGRILRSNGAGLNATWENPNDLFVFENGLTEVAPNIVRLGGTLNQASTTVNMNDNDLTFSNGAGTSTFTLGTGAGTTNVVVTPGAAGTVTVNNLPAGAQTDDRLVIDGANQVRRIPSIGAVYFARKAASTTRNGGVAPAADADLTIAVAGTQTFEFEIYVQYSGSHSPESSLDLAVTGPVAAAADISYGVVTAGQALAPSNVDGSGSLINDIGVDIAPAQRVTVLVKGFITTNAAGNVTFVWGDDTNNGAGETLTVHANSYIKLTRVQ